jgi:hypothetical protein
MLLPMVPAIALNVAQIQKTQPQAPGALVLGQPFQPVSNLCVLIAQHRAVAIAGLADLLSGSGLLANHERMERTTRQCNADTTHCDRI